MFYRREIDGLRALAVIPVILFHAGFKNFSGGFVGVDIFFVISGYLITSIILEELEQGRFSVINFYERRARRILPVLFLVILVCMPFSWLWLLPNDMKDFSQSLVAVSVFASNILFWWESGYFDTASELKPLLHTWSLAVEEQYYLLFPLLLMLFWHLGKRWILFMLGIIMVSSIMLAQWVVYTNQIAAFYFLPTRVWELLIGALTAFYLSYIKSKEFSKITVECCTWVGMILIFYAIFFYSNKTPFPGLYALVPTLGATFIILFATPQSTVGKLLGSKVFVSVGLISYSAYLWHQPIFAFARHRFLNEANNKLFLLLTAVTLIIAYLSWRFVEVPFRKLGAVSKKFTFILGLVFTLLFATIGYIGHITDGFKNRFDYILLGDIGHVDFLKHIDNKYYDCEPNIVAKNAWKWEQFLRCKQSKLGMPEIILLGDSHAEHLFIGLAEHIPNRNIAYYVQDAKPYIEDEAYKYIFHELLNNNLRQHVILTMHFNYRVDAYGSGLYEGFSGTIRALIKAGKSVTLIGDVPRFIEEPGYCLYSADARSKKSCILERDDVERQLSVYDGILQDLAKDYGLIYLKIYENLCADNLCGMAKDNTILYRDNNHLNIIGSKLVGKSIAERLPLK